MDPFKSNSTSNSKSQGNASVNPFARALAESEKRTLSNATNSTNNGGANSFDTDNQISENSLFNADQHQQQLTEQQEILKKQQMRDKLHRMVNPVEQTDIFNAREEQRKKEINEVREELKALAQEIAMFYKEVDITLTQTVVSPGQSGVYHQNFFTKLKEFIQMLREQVNSARTWARQAQMKKKKRRYKHGLDFSGEEAKSSHDMLHHERSNAFGA
ncbi:MAG: hypothetical protein XD95_0182 [Microgenomates bacterium 39_7]|nr:MAG: hypothetical protein XD95_0182 [Microgenomates bacterium 39_7]